MIKVLTEKDVNAEVWARFLKLCEIHKLQDGGATNLKLIEVEGHPCAAQYTLADELKVDEHIQPIKEDGTLYPIQGVEIKAVFKRYY